LSDLCRFTALWIVQAEDKCIFLHITVLAKACIAEGLIFKLW
jgi:hypothetical protein